MGLVAGDARKEKTLLVTPLHPTSPIDVYASEFQINHEHDLQRVVWNPDGFRRAASGPNLGRRGY
jgi:hypothetical protein